MHIDFVLLFIFLCTIPFEFRFISYVLIPQLQFFSYFLQKILIMVHRIVKISPKLLVVMKLDGHKRIKYETELDLSIMDKKVEVAILIYSFLFY
jgi:hypothetical protein